MLPREVRKNVGFRGTPFLKNMSVEYRGHFRKNEKNQFPTIFLKKRGILWERRQTETVKFHKKACHKVKYKEI